MNSIENLIIKLNQTDSFKYFLNQKDSFEAFKMMKITRKEAIHSRILAFLLSYSNNHENSFWQNFVKLIIEKIPTADQIWQNLKNEQPINIFTEYSFKSSKEENFENPETDNYLDLLIKSQNYAIVIENKIYAGEGKNQILRYQEYLSKRTEAYKLLIYLTISGKESTSKSDNYKNVSTINLCWSDIYYVLKESTFNDEQQGFILLFEKHLYNNFIMHQELKNECYKLFKTETEAYNKLVKNYDYCINRLTVDWFSKLIEKLKTNPKYRELNCPGEVKAFDTAGKGKYYISLKKPDWPESLSIKVYRYHILGVFPCLMPDQNGETSFGDLNFYKFKFHKTNVKYFSKKYFTNNEKDNTEERCVKKDKTKLNDEDFKVVFSKIDKYKAEIEEILNRQQK